MATINTIPLKSPAGSIEVLGKTLFAIVAIMLIFNFGPAISRNAFVHDMGQTAIGLFQDYDGGYKSRHFIMQTEQASDIEVDAANISTLQKNHPKPSTKVYYVKSN